VPFATKRIKFKSEKKREEEEGRRRRRKRGEYKGREEEGSSQFH